MTLAILLVVTLIALWLVAPTRQVLVDLISRSASSDVSLSFLKQLNQTHPNDSDIQRLMLINHFKLGDYEEITSLLKEGMTQDLDNQDPQLILLYLKTLLLKPALSDQALIAQHDEVRDILTRVSMSPTSLTQTAIAQDADLAQEFADIALQVGMPNLAFKFQYPYLKESQQGRKVLVDLALQSGNLTAALELQQQIFIQEQTLDNADSYMSLLASSFNPKQSQQFFSQYLSSQQKSLLIESPEFLTRVMTHSQLMGNYQVALQYAQQLASVEPSADHYAKVAALAIQVNQLPLAIESLQKALSYQERREFYSQLHQIYTWQGDITQAQAMSLWLLEHNPSIDELRFGINESKALGDIESEARFYYLLVSHNKIIPSEYAEWLNAVEKGLGTSAAISQVEQLLQYRPEDAALLSNQVRLYNYQSEYEKVVRTGEILRRLRPLSLKEAGIISDAYIMLGQNQNALTTLTSVPDWNTADEAYLTMVSSLAWQQSNKPLLLQSQRTLIARQSDNIDGYKVLRAMQPLSAEGIEELIEIYRIHQDSGLLMDTLRYSEQLGDATLFKSVLALADADPNLQDNLELLFFHAQLAEMEGNPLEARDYYARILQREPQNKQALLGLFWLALDTQDDPLQAKLYQQYRIPMQHDPDFWLVFASTAQSLGQWEQAEFWYKKVLSKDQDNISVLLNYANLLDSQGLHEQAYQMRRYLLKQKTQQLMEVGDKQMTYRQLISLYFGPSVSAQMAEQFAKASPSQDIAQELYGYLLAEQNIQRIQFWQYRAAFSRYTLPDWQQLSMAVQQGDKERVNQLLQTSIGLSEVDKHNGLRLVGKQQQAWELGEQKIGRVQTEEQNAALRQSQAQLHPDKVHATQGEVSNIDHWGVWRYSVNYYRPQQNGYWRLGTSMQQAETPDLIAGTDVDDELRLTAGYGYQFDDGQWLISADIADGVGDPRLGLLFEYQQQIDRRMNGRIRLGLNNHSEASQLMNIAGQDSLVGVGLNYQLTDYEALDFLANYHFLSTRFGDDIGQGWEVNVRATEQLFRADTAWQLYADLAWQKADLTDQELTGFNQWQKGPVPLTGGSFLSDEYQRFSIGQRFWHGEPGQPGASVPSPHYWLDTSVGYNFTESNIDFGVGAGLGWRILGNDELSLSANWQSQDRNGEQSLTTTLGYYYRF